MRSQCSGHLEPRWVSVVQPSFLAVLLSIIVFLFLSASLPPSLPLPPSFSTVNSQCHGCPDVPVGAHGWVVGIASHGSVLLSRAWLITVKTPGHPGHPPSTQLSAVVNLHLYHPTSGLMQILHFDQLRY